MKTTSNMKMTKNKYDLKYENNVKYEGNIQFEDEIKYQTKTTKPNLQNWTKHTQSNKIKVPKLNSYPKWQIQTMLVNQSSKDLIKGKQV